MAHIVIICTANTCRSPLVEVLIRNKLAKSGHEDWTVSSAGIRAALSNPAALYSQRIAQREGLDLSNHTSRMVSDEIMTKADLAIVMTKEHRDLLQSEFNEARDRIFLLSEMIDKSDDVVDPYGGSSEAYENMFVEVSNLINQGINKIVRLTLDNANTRQTD